MIAGIHVSSSFFDSFYSRVTESNRSNTHQICNLCQHSFESEQDNFLTEHWTLGLVILDCHHWYCDCQFHGLFGKRYLRETDVWNPLGSSHSKALTVPNSRSQPDYDNNCDANSVINAGDKCSDWQASVIQLDSKDTNSYS